MLMDMDTRPERQDTREERRETLPVPGPWLARKELRILLPRELSRLKIRRNLTVHPRDSRT